jgi:hypothetical protein
MVRMRAILVVVLLAAGCVEQEGPVVEVLVDEPERSSGDACTREPDTEGCCALMPDAEAVGACAAETVEPGVCGVAVCWQADCSLTRVNFCRL